MQNKNKPVFPLIMLFLIVNAFLLTMPAFFEKHNIDRDVLIIANTLLFVTNFAAFFLQRKALQNKNPNVFVRSMMGSMMIKMLVLLGAFLIYVIAFGKTVNKPAIYISLFLYLLYLAVEVMMVMKLNKQKNA
jgi:hypothetical protein